MVVSVIGQFVRGRAHAGSNPGRAKLMDADEICKYLYTLSLSYV